MIPHSVIFDTEGFGVTTALLNGKMYTADSNHPRFEQINQLLSSDADADEVIVLFDVKAGIAKTFERLSDRVTMQGDDVFFDGDKRNGVLVDHLVDFVQEGHKDTDALLKFWENLEANPQPDSRDSLYGWIAKAKLTTTDEGNFVGYKAVSQDEDGKLWSKTAGDNAVIVDGESVTGYVPNNPGSLVEMPRNEVWFDPATGCATGLHVGTYLFAHQFGNIGNGDVIVSVLVNPRDVVSVPNEDHGKMRVCRYKVLDVVDAPQAQAYTSFADALADVRDDDDTWFDSIDNDDYDSEGYDADGYDEDGFDESGFDRDGFDYFGFDEDGFDRDGFDVHGYDSDGYDEDGKDEAGNPKYDRSY